MPFNQEQRDKLKEYYTQYINNVRPLITLIEARQQKFPTPILNEVRAFHDHIARCYSDNCQKEEIDTEIRKAKSHIKRMLLDSFKFLCTFAYDDVKEFERKYEKIDLTIINNGDFLLNFRKINAKAEKNVKKAKDCETLAQFEEAFQCYELAYNEYEKLIDYIDNNIENLTWARNRELKISWKERIGWIISVIISSLVSGIAAAKGWTPLFENITKFFSGS